MVKKDFRKTLGSKGLEFFSATDAAKVKGWVSTGNYALNWVVGGRFHRGWPLGHVAEIFGEPATGKTFVISRTIAAAQQMGFETLLDDTEGAFNPDWAQEVLGIDTDSLVYAHSATISEHEKVVAAFLDAVEEADAKGVVNLDSLALLTTEHELENPDKVSLTRAKEVRALFRRLGSRISKLPVIYLVTNHTIANIGNFYQPKTTPGGTGLKYQASVRLEMRSMKKLKDKSSGDIVGVWANAYVEKNRITAPWKFCRIIIPFYKGISLYSGLIPVLLNLSVIAESGQTLVYQGKDTKIKTYKSDPVKQDESAEELVKTYPDILTVADQYLGELDQVRAQTFEAEVEE